MTGEVVLDGVAVVYPGASGPVLDSISLTIASGSFVVLAGESGSGKSTLLGLICGIVPHATGGTVSGRVTVCGRDTREHGPAALAAHVGTLTQDPERQVILTTVRAELAFPLENAGEAPAAVARGVEEVALALGIERLLDRRTAELSGGELQRVALGAALARRPQVLVLDEPTSQLDPVAGDELLWLLRRLNEEWGTTVIVSEHRLERCLAPADRVIVLDGGRLVCDAAPPAFLDWAGDHAPALQTPVAALWRAAGLPGPAPAGVKDARTRLPSLMADDPAAAGGERPRQRGGATPVLAFERVWYEPRDGRAILRGLDLSLAAGERVALMGRNGAGKSTLLRHAAGLLEPTRGHVDRAGRVGLLLQDPGAYLLCERVGDEASAAALAQVGLGELHDRHPASLSGGERQRLALAIVLDGGERPPVIALDEPTRGMDRAAKGLLAGRLAELAAAGSAVIVATHDPEFAARLADRVVLLADGRMIADGPVADVLRGGWYFTTEVARVTGGRALLPEDGAALLAASTGPQAADTAEVSA